MVTADITRELGIGKDGRRKYIYSVAVQGKPMQETFESPRKARIAAAERLRWYAHSNQIVERWTDGQRFRANFKGKPVVWKDEEHT
jgi:hypothetical protein